LTFVLARWPLPRDGTPVRVARQPARPATERAAISPWDIDPKVPVVGAQGTDPETERR